VFLDDDILMIYGSPLVSSNSQAHEPASLHRHGASWKKLLVMLPLSNAINLLVLSPQGSFGNDPFHQDKGVPPR
jgi:hypothetical protein